MPCSLLWKIQSHLFSNFVLNKWCLSSVASFCFDNVYVAVFWHIYVLLFEYVTHNHSKHWCLFLMVFILHFFSWRIFSNFSKLKRLNDSIFAFCMNEKHTIKRHYPYTEFQELRVFSTCQLRFMRKIQFFEENIFYKIS